MIFHLSISARDPQLVAEVLAELWQGQAFPFRQGVAGSWVAMAGDDRNSAIEVYPHGYILSPKDDASEKWPVPAQELQGSATHAAIATALSTAEVVAIAEREGWHTNYIKRGNLFGIIEFWVENRILFEVLPPEMQAEYLETQTIERWRAAQAKAA